MDPAEIAFVFAIMALLAVTALSVGVKKQLKLAEIKRIRHEASTITGVLGEESEKDFEQKLRKIAATNQDQGFLVFNRNNKLSVGLFCDAGPLAAVEYLCLDPYTSVENGRVLNIRVVNELGIKMMEFEESANLRFARLTADFVPRGPSKARPLYFDCDFMNRRFFDRPECCIKGDMLPDLQKSVTREPCPEAEKPSICDDIDPIATTEAYTRLKNVIVNEDI